MSIHQNQHEMAGEKVIIKGGEFDGAEYRIEDWWDRVAGKSWMFCDGNPACLDFAMRSAFDGTSTDDEVVYGKIGAYGKLIHISQLGEPVAATAPVQETDNG